MTNSQTFTQKKKELARGIAGHIVVVMGDTGTSFEMLAEKLNVSNEEIRRIIYGIEREITLNQLISIFDAMDRILDTKSLWYEIGRK